MSLNNAQSFPSGSSRSLLESRCLYEPGRIVKEHMSKKICILLSSYERELVEEYGYPFEEISDQLEKGRESPDPLILEADQYWMEQLLGDLSRSINHRCVPDEQTGLAVNEIAERIELAMQSV